MATCNTNALLASGKHFQQLYGGFNPIARLALLKNMLLAINPAADTSVNALLASGKCFACLTNGEQSIVRLQLLCEILAVTDGGGGAVCECSVATLTSLVVLDDNPVVVQLDWTFNPGLCLGGSFQIYRSLNGVDYILWATVSDAIRTYTSTGNNPIAPQPFTGVSLKIKYVNADLDCNFSNVLSAGPE